MPGEHSHFGALIKVVDFALGQLRSKHLSHALQQLQRQIMIEIEEYSPDPKLKQVGCTEIFILTATRNQSLGQIASHKL